MHHARVVAGQPLDQGGAQFGAAAGADAGAEVAQRGAANAPFLDERNRALSLSRAAPRQRHVRRRRSAGARAARTTSTWAAAAHSTPRPRRPCRCGPPLTTMTTWETRQAQTNKWLLRPRRLMHRTVWREQRRSSGRHRAAGLREAMRLSVVIRYWGAGWHATDS
jgi:hypothetical protein